MRRPFLSSQPQPDEAIHVPSSSTNPAVMGRWLRSSTCVEAFESSRTRSGQLLAPSGSDPDDVWCENPISKLSVDDILGWTAS
jgi:hypothetical protein